MGWCGLDGSRNHTEPEIFVLLDEPYRGKGYGTMCVKEMLRIATEDYAILGVHGGCAKENISSSKWSVENTILDMLHIRDGFKELCAAVEEGEDGESDA